MVSKEETKDAEARSSGGKVAYIGVPSPSHCNFVSFASAPWSSQPTFSLHRHLNLSQPDHPSMDGTAASLMLNSTPRSYPTHSLQCFAKGLAGKNEHQKKIPSESFSGHFGVDLIFLIQHLNTTQRRYLMSI